MAAPVAIRYVYYVATLFPDNPRPAFARISGHFIQSFD
jgi:hypothetical protein